MAETFTNPVGGGDFGNVPQGNAGTGAAFILPEGRAVDRYREDVKAVLEDAARKKAQMNKVAADLGDIDTDKAWDVDLPELMQEKTKVRDAAAQLMMKQAHDKKYAGSIQYYQDLNDLNRKKDDLMMYAQASGQHKALYDKQLADMVNANEGKYDAATSAERLAKYMRGSEDVNAPIGGLGAIRNRMGQGNRDMLVQLPKFDYEGSISKWTKNVGDESADEINGLIKTGRKNIMTDASGQPTSFGKKVDTAVDRFVASKDGQNAVRMYVNSGKSQSEAIESVKKDLKSSIDTRISKSEYHPPVGKEEQVSPTAVKPVDVTYNDGTPTNPIPTTGKLIPYNLKKPLNIGSNMQGVIDASTGSQITDIPPSAKFVPEGSKFGIDPGMQIKAQGKTPASAISNVNHTVRGEITYSTPKEEAEVLASLIKNKSIKLAEDDERDEITLDNLTADEKALVEDAATEQNKIHKKTVYVPFNNVKGLLPTKAASHYEKEFDNYKKSQSTSSAPQKLTGTVDPAKLQKGQKYEVNGKHYIWNGKNLVIQ